MFEVWALACTKMLASNATDLQALRIRGQVAGGEVEQLWVPVFPGPASAWHSGAEKGGWVQDSELAC